MTAPKPVQKFVQITIADAERIRGEIRSWSRTTMHMLGMAVGKPFMGEKEREEVKAEMKEDEALLDRLTIAIHEANKP